MGTIGEWLVPCAAESQLNPQRWTSACTELVAEDPRRVRGTPERETEHRSQWGIGVFVKTSNRVKLKTRAARMKIDQPIGTHDEGLPNPMRPTLCLRARGIAGEQAVKVALIGRRETDARLIGHGVHNRQGNDPSGKCSARQFTHSTADRFGPLVLIAVHRTGEKPRRAR